MCVRLYKSDIFIFLSLASGPGLTLSYFNGEQHGQKLPIVSDQHGVINQRHGLLHCILDRNGRDVFSSCCDDQL